MDINSLVAWIIEKKELSGINQELVKELIGDYLAKNKIKLELLTKQELKIVVKDIRSNLREYSGRFRASYKDREKLLKKGDYDSLLMTHSSTKERMQFYPKLREIISGLHINSILDLGCGLNPIALANPGISYYASDINQEELSLIDEFFIKNKIQGRTFQCNLAKPESCNFPKADLCIIFKVLDILGKNDYILAEKIISRISSKFILASFSTKTLSGKSMNKPRRIWLEKLLKSKRYSVEIIKSGNEIFYLARSEQ